MSCNIIYDSKGGIQEVLTDSGTPSNLFKEAKDKLGEEKALEIFYVSQSDDFKDSRTSVEEPSLNEVMQYITAQNQSKEPMTEEQKQDFRNATISTKNFSYENLKKAFYDENGIFIVVPSKLIASELYSQYEAEHIFKNIELQEKVKQSIEALKNTDIEYVSVEEDFSAVEKEGEFTSFGKLNNLNPYIVQKQIQETLAATTREEFDELIGELPFSNFQKTMQSAVAKDALFNSMQAFKKAEMMIEVNGVIKPSLNSNTEVIVPQVAQDLSGTKVLEDILRFMNQDLTILNRFKDETKTILEGIEKRLLKQGYDVIRLSSKTPDVNMIQYFNTLVQLSSNATRENLNNYVEIYDTYFEKDLAPKKGFLKTEQDDRNFVKLDTNLTEEEVYNQQGLIKQDEGLYIKVNKKSSDELYPIVLSYPEKLPSNVKTEEDLRKYIQSTLNNDEITTTETGEIITLFKIYYDIPLVAEPKKIYLEDFSQKAAQFDGNTEYLTKEFVSDFYIKGLQEKAKASKEYRDFYRHFEVTEKGLELINQDQITLDTLQPYVTEDLANYSLLSRTMPNLSTNEAEVVESKNLDRNKISNFPNSVKKSNLNVNIIDNNHLILKNTNKEFVKFKNDIFENVQTIDNLSMFVKIVKNDKTKYFNFAVEKPQTDIKLEDYLHLSNQIDKTVQRVNHLTKGEKENLAEGDFSCL